MTQLKTPPKNPAPILRRAQPRDVPAICHLGSTTFTSTFGYSLPASDLSAYLLSTYSASSIGAEVASPLIDFLVAVNASDHVIGFVQLTRETTDPCIALEEKPVELQRLYVDERYHGVGVGRALVNEVEGIARERGFETLWLGVWEENLKAQRAYEKWGFGKCGEHDFVMGTCVQTDWIMKKSL